jgi:5-methylthioadenosine/S-adenosylhomocysteine deaminase
VLTIDYEAASAALEEAQQRGLSRIRQLDWAGRSAEEIAGSAFPRR